jgi:hypothetical protein
METPDKLLAEKLVDDLDGKEDTEVLIQGLSLALNHFTTVRFEEMWKERIFNEFDEINAHRKDATTLRSFRPYELEDYIDEAEHQDGTAYWTQFTDGRQLMEDVIMYYQEEEDD